MGVNEDDKPVEYRNSSDLILGRFKLLGKHLGEGTYGHVVNAVDTLTNKLVAIKKVKNIDYVKPEGNVRDRQLVGMVGIHFTTLRELKVMCELDNENLMGLVTVFVKDGFINIVMDMMYSDLKKIIDSKIRLGDNHVKCIIKQILSGLRILHECSFSHRDLSPANIFIDNYGTCKIADFGLARRTVYPPIFRESPDIKSLEMNASRERMTFKVVTLWYRSPELLLGAECYHFACDMWSIGCILAELLNGKPLFPGSNEIDQLGKIYQICGTPNEDIWPNVTKLPLYTPYTHSVPKRFTDLFPHSNEVTLDLLAKMLTLNPNKRITVQEALEHEYFKTQPLASKSIDLPFDFIKR